MTSQFVSSMLSAINQVSNLIYRSGRDSLKLEIEKLDRKLRRIEATIEELEQREIHDETVKLWLKELKCLANDAEDVLDGYQYELLWFKLVQKPDLTTILSGKDSAMFYNSEPCIAKVNRSSPCIPESISVELMEDIRQINIRYEEISTDRKALQLTREEGVRRGGTYSKNLSSTSHFTNTDGVFGRSDNKKEIIGLLLSGILWDEGKDQVRIIPILGMGGIGKTTLAQIVYLDPFVQSMFDTVAWVHVSPEFDIIRITKEICEVVTGSFGNSFDGFNKIQEVLQKELMGKTMLLVLDDVWNVQPIDWEMLFFPLRVAELVRVLVTSRSDAVVHTLNGVTAYHLDVTPHQLEVLPEHESWKLFCNFVFTSQNMNKVNEIWGLDPHLSDQKKYIYMNKEIWSIDIGCQIIKKCGGLPLAIKCIAAVLRYNGDKESWMEILNSEFWESDKLEPVFQALKVSYYYLPPKLRECFLFCSLFPKGSRLKRNPIIHMWMAHRFLRPIGRKTAEDLGEQYLDELQTRSFLVPYTKDCFLLHDIIYDFAKSICGDEICTITDHKVICVPDKIRHLYIKKGYDPSQSFRPSWLRTLFNASLRTHDSSVNLHDISFTRVLGLIGSNVYALACASLKHLHYLGIREFNGERLPESLCLLYHLQTLQITHCYHLIELPTNIANLVNLRYLHIAQVRIWEVPVSLWEVHNLRILYLKKCCNIRVLPLGISKLIHLHSLQLKSCKQLEELPADIGNLINLTRLDLSFSGIRTLPESIFLLKSVKSVLVGLSDRARTQLDSYLSHHMQSHEHAVDDAEEMSENSCSRKYHDQKIHGETQEQNVRSRKLILPSSSSRQQMGNIVDNRKTVVDDANSVDWNTWMTSQDSTLETVSHFNANFNF